MTSWPLNDVKMDKIEHCVPHNQSNSLAAQVPHSVYQRILFCAEYM